MTGIFDGHNIEVTSTPLNRLEEQVATNAALTQHINDNTDPHGVLLRQTTLAINDNVILMSDSSGLRIVDYTNSANLDNLLLNNLDIRGTLDVADNIITLSSQTTGTPSASAGITVERGTETNSNLLWDETNDYWALSDDSPTLHRLLDQRDRDELDAEDLAIRQYVTDNYVHRTDNIAETVSGIKTYSANANFQANVDVTGSQTIHTDLNVGGNAVITGDLTVNGTTTTVNTQDLNVSDNIVNLNSDVTGTPTENSGIAIIRGTSPTASIIWNETSDTWTLTDDGINFYKIADQRNVDALNTSITNLANNVNANYVHRTGSVNESISGSKTFTSATQFSSNVSVGGNTTVTGSTNLNGILNVKDNHITINSNNTAQNAAFQVYRGTSPVVALRWNEANDTWELTQDGSNYYRMLTTNDTGAGANLDSDSVDGYDAVDFTHADVNAIKHTTTLHAGWHTIAINPTGRAAGKFTLRDQTSGMHQNLYFNAGVMYGQRANIQILNNSVYAATPPFDGLRIKTGSTYDGAMLQVHIVTDLNSLQLFVTDNILDSGWTLKDFVADGTDPGGLNNYSAVTTITTQILPIYADRHTYFSGDIYANHTPTGSPALVWTAANDGSGSGLDADLLDGHHGAVTASANNYVLRDSNADINVRLVKSNYPAQNTPPAVSIGILFRADNSSNPYHRAMNNTAFSAWCQNAHIKAYDSIHLGGMLPHAGRNNEANKIVRTNSSGYLQAGWIDTLSGNAGTNAISRIYASYDGFIRYYSPLNFANQILAQGSVKNAHTHTFLTVPDTRSTDTAPNGYGKKLAAEFKYRNVVNNPGTTGTYCGVLTFAPWGDSSGDNGYQLAFTKENGLAIRTADLGATSWGAWAKIWHNHNDGSGSGLDADLLRGKAPSTGISANTIALRDSVADISARLFRSNYATQTTTPASSAAIAFRNSTSDDYIRFMNGASFKAWLNAIGYVSSVGNSHSGTQWWSSSTPNIYATINLPSNAPHAINSYWVNVTVTGNDSAANVGSVYVLKGNSSFNVYRTGSYTGAFDYVITWN